MIKAILAHLAIDLSGMYIVFWCIDLVNPAMVFINNGITKFLLLMLCLDAIAMAVLLIKEYRDQLRAQNGQTAPKRKVKAKRPHEGEFD